MMFFKQFVRSYLYANLYGLLTKNEHKYLAPDLVYDDIPGVGRSGGAHQGGQDSVSYEHVHLA